MANGNGGGGSTSAWAPYQVEIEKYYQGEYWVNRYFTDGASLGDAQINGLGIAEAERLFHSSAVTFTKLSVRTTLTGDDAYATVILNSQGLRTESEQLMPLFVVLRVDLQALQGRPSRKYYRGVLTELDVATMQLTGDFLNNWRNVVGGIVVGNNILDPQGTPIVQALVNPNVGMRQLRRGSKKKSVPSSGGVPV